MPGSATVIGRVAVKVVPDTGDFRGEAQRELTAIEKSLKKLEIDFTANLTDAEREAERAVDAAEKVVKNKEITLKFDMRNQDELVRTINQIDRELDKLKERTTVHVDLEDDAHLRQLREVLEDELEKAKPAVQVRLEEYALRKAQGRMAYLARTRFATIVPHVNEAAAAKAGATLAALSGGRGLFNIASDFGEWVGNLDKSIPSITAASLAITNLSGYVLTATSNTLTFGASLASIGGTALALPGIFGGMALGIGASIAVLKDFNEVLPRVGKRFKNLQDDMSEDFWNNAEEPFRRFINEIFPQFKDGMRETSDSLGIFFGNFADSATGQFDGELKAMFEDLGDSIEVAAQYTDNMLSVLEQLGSVGAGNLPRLAGWFGEVTEDFDNWLQRKGPEGLQEFVDEGIRALKDLGGVLSATGSMFAGLARAAEDAGGSTLAIMRDTMEGVAETVNSPGFQHSLRGVFRGAHEAMGEISERSGPEFQSFIERLGDTLESVLPSAGRAAGDALGAIFDALDQDVVQNSVITLFEDLEGVIDTLAPTLPGVAEALAALVETVGDVATNLAGALAPALDTLAPAFVDLTDDLDPLIDQLGELLENVVRGGAPVLADLADHAGNLAGALADILRPVNALLDAFGSLPGPVKSATSELAALSLLVGGAAWMGTAVKGKVMGLSGSLLDLSTKAGRGQGALLTMASGAERVGTRMSGLKWGLAGGAAALTGLATEAAGADSKLGAVASVGGAALTGFFVGGPWGAAIGGAVGALGQIISHAKDSGEAAEVAKTSWDGLRSTLNEVTGATTAATAAFIYDKLERDDVFDLLDSEGIARRTVVDAIMGEKGAREELAGVIAGEKAELADLEAQLESATRKQAAGAMGSGDRGATAKVIEDLEKQVAAQKKVIEAIESGTDKVKKDTAAQRERSRAITDYAGMFKGDKIPRAVITRFEQEGIPRSERKMASLVRQYDKLDLRKVRTIIEETGADLSVRKIKRLLGQLDTADKKRANPVVKVETKVADRDVSVIAGKLKEIDRTEGKPKLSVEDKASKPTEEAKKKVQDFGKLKGVPTLEVNDNATPRILDVRESLEALDGRTATVTINHRTIYSKQGNGPSAGDVSPAPNQRSAFAAAGARDATFAVTAQVVAVEVDADAAAQAGIKLANSVSFAMTRTMMQRSNKINNVFKQLLRESNSSLDKAYRRRFQKRITDFETDVKQMNRYLNQLREAKARLERLREEMRQFKEQVTDTFMATVDPSALGSSYEQIVNGMQVSVERAQRFATAIDQLIAMGLNDTTLRQIIAAGPEAALDAAEAIVDGGVGAINDAQAEIDKAASQVGKNAGDALFEDLVGEASGRVEELVKALKPLQKALRKEARALVQALTDELKKELKKAGSGNSKQNRPAVKRAATRQAAIPKSGARALESSGAESGRTLNYYAAPGPQLTAEEQLFSASDRGRMTFP